MGNIEVKETLNRVDRYGNIIACEILMLFAFLKPACVAI